MPRSARIVVSNCPHYIIQRGHNRSRIYFENEDYHYYLNDLYEIKQQLDIKLYAYCLMPEHIQLILDPGNHPENLGILMKRVSARHTRRININQRRTGSLWDSRYKSSPIQAENYFLSCCRYLEYTPVQENLAQSPQEYQWSSHAHRTKKHIDKLVDAFPENILSAKALQQVNDFYLNKITQPISKPEMAFIHQARSRGQAIGDNDFITSVEMNIDHPFKRRSPGRPKGKINSTKSLNTLNAAFVTNDQ